MRRLLPKAWLSGKRFSLCKKRTPLILSRQNSFIGVMIDDLVTTHLDEPYRMFTSRAEHRLFLRADNCYSRLYDIAVKHSLLTKEQALRCRSLFNKEASIEKWINASKKTINNKKIPIKNYLKRPEVSITETLPINYFDGALAQEAAFNVETKIKYEGYIKNELERISVARGLEGLKSQKSLNTHRCRDFQTNQKTGWKRFARNTWAGLANCRH